MPFQNYEQLKAAVGGWLDRPDLDKYIPDFISLAELKLNRDLRVRGMEDRATATTDQAYLALPPGFLQAKRLLVLTQPPRVLTYRTPEQLVAEYGGQRGRPAVFTVSQDEMQFGPAPDTAYAFEMIFYKQVPPLSGQQPNNWFLQYAYDALLYGALLEAMVFLDEDSRLPVWKGLYENAVADLKSQDERDRHSGSTLVVRPG